MKVKINAPKINAKLNTQLVYPELEDLEVTPSSIEQDFKSNKYGYDNVKVKEVETDTLNVTPTTENQEYIGLYGIVNISGVDSSIDSNIKAENIKEGVEILGVEGSVVPEKTSIALKLYDWDGTLLYWYDKEGALALEELPIPNTEYELLQFQEWNWSLENIKDYITTYPDSVLQVGATYTSTDGQDHYYSYNERLELPNSSIYMVKKGTTTYDASLVGRGCLRKSNIPRNSSIASYFRGASSLESIVIPKTITSLNNQAFYDCRSVHSIILPDSITTLGSSCFQSCFNLKSINLPKNITSIPDKIFGSDSSLENVIIPNSVTSIGDQAFTGCRSIESIKLPDSITTIRSYAFQNCHSIKEINLPSSLKTIGGNAFQYCRSLTLKNPNFPNGLTSIGANVFYDCYAISKVSFSENLTSIGDLAFSYTRSLSDIVIKGTPTMAGVNAFQGIPSNARFYVWRENLSWFETATNWSTYYADGKIVAIEDYVEYLTSIGIDV